MKKRIDYYPFGMPMPNRKVVNGEPYRYAYQGQEIDSETGKEAFQLRLWDARIGRWLTTDPKREFASPYLGMGNNPVNKIDPDGGSTSEPLDDYKLIDGKITFWRERAGEDRLYIGDEYASFTEGFLADFDIENNGYSSSLVMDAQKLAYFISTNLYKEVSGYGFELGGENFIQILPYKDADYTWNTDGAIDADPMINGMTAGNFSFKDIVNRGNIKFLFHTHPMIDPLIPKYGITNHFYKLRGIAKPSESDFQGAEILNHNYGVQVPHYIFGVRGNPNQNFNNISLYNGSGIRVYDYVQKTTERFGL